MGSRIIETLILVNPKARNGVILSHWTELHQEILSALGLNEAKVVFTSSEDHGSGLVKKALKEGFKQIVVVGGDGTLSEVIQGFFENEKAIAPDAVLMLMPGGRGDDFFKSMSHHFDLSSRSAWKQGLEILKYGTPQPVDVGRIRWVDSSSITPTIPATSMTSATIQGSKDFPVRYFMNIVSFGFPSLVVHRLLTKQGILANSFLEKSAWAYVLEALTAVSKYKAIAVEVKVDDQVFYQGKMSYGFVLNGSYNSGGICWNPDTRIDDGLFNIRIIEASNLWNQFKRLSKVVMGSVGPISGVWSAQGKKIEVCLNRGEVKEYPLFEVDGDTPEPDQSLGAVIDIIPSGIQLKMPNKVK